MLVIVIVAHYTGQSGCAQSAFIVYINVRICRSSVYTDGGGRALYIVCWPVTVSSLLVYYVYVLHVYLLLCSLCYVYSWLMIYVAGTVLFWLTVNL